MATIVKNIIIPIDSSFNIDSQIEFCQNFIEENIKFIFVHIFECELEYLARKLNTDPDVEFDQAFTDEKFKMTLSLISNSYQEVLKQFDDLKKGFKKDENIETHIVLTRGKTIEERLTEFVLDHPAVMIILSSNKIRDFFGYLFKSMTPHILSNCKIPITILSIK